MKKYFVAVIKTAYFHNLGLVFDYWAAIRRGYWCKFGTTSVQLHTYSHTLTTPTIIDRYTLISPTRLFDPFWQGQGQPWFNLSPK